MKKILATIIVAVVAFTLVACKQSEKLTVSFDPGYEGATIFTQKVSKGQLVEEPSEIIIRDGYEFEFWTLRGAKYYFDTPVNNDIKLVGKWEGEELAGIKHIITFDSDGGSFISPVKVVDEGQLKEPIEPFKMGFVFESWQLDGVDYNFDEEVTRSFTLKATYRTKDNMDLHPYYQDRGLDNTTGEEFRKNLQNRLKDGMIVLKYGGGLNPHLVQADKHPTIPGNVYTIYDGAAMGNNADGANGPSVWNKEHVMPQSWYVPSVGNKGDLHNLRVARASINSDRGNDKFASGTGKWKAKTNGGFYPGDDHRGDSARIAMYMMVRFPNQISPSIAFAGKEGVNLMLKWHLEDPVDDFEIRRNDILYGIQKNRNPFIDHPEFAQLIWGAYNANLTQVAKFKTIANTIGLFIDLVSMKEVIIPNNEIKYI